MLALNSWSFCLCLLSARVTGKKKILEIINFKKERFSFDSWFCRFECMVRHYHCSQPCDRQYIMAEKCMVKQTLSHGWDGREEETGECILSPLRTHPNNLKTSHKVLPLNIPTCSRWHTGLRPNPLITWTAREWVQFTIMPKCLLNVWCSKTLICCSYFWAWASLYNPDWPPNCSPSVWASSMLGLWGWATRCGDGTYL